MSPPALLELRNLGVVVGVDRNKGLREGSLAEKAAGTDWVTGLLEDDNSRGPIRNMMISIADRRSEDSPSPNLYIIFDGYMIIP